MGYYHVRNEDDPFDFVINSFTSYHNAGEKVACFLVAWAEHKGLIGLDAKTAASLASWSPQNAKEMLERPRNTPEIIRQFPSTDGKKLYRLARIGEAIPRGTE